MQVAVTGAAGLLGRRVIERLLADDHLAGPDGAPTRIDRIIASDIGGVDVFADPRIVPEAGDITAPDFLARAVPAGTDAIFHLAAIVSSQAEEDFELGMRVNFDAARALLEHVRRSAPGARLVTTSSVAVFGGALPPAVPDSQVWEPQSSYGTQKALVDLLLSDYARRGYVDARSLRMPTVVVRPGKPNRAASSFASGIIREPLAGIEAVCPVDADTLLWLISPDHAVANIIHGHDLPPERLGARRVINLPGLSITVRHMLDALARAGGDRAASLVRIVPDPAVQRIVNSWPGDFEAAYGRSLGFTADCSFDDIIDAYLRSQAGAHG